MTHKNLLLPMLYSIFGGFVLGMAFANMAVPQAFSSVDSSTFREWLSALSGWVGGAAAIVAALLTVRTLRAQIAEGGRQHLELMKFQAHEKLLLIQQVDQAASNVNGTVVQIFHEWHDGPAPTTHEKISSYVDAAKFALELLVSSDLPRKREMVQGSLPPELMRIEFALPKFIEFAELALKIPEQSLVSEMGQNALRNASSNLMLAHEDIKDLSREMRDFRRRWLHLMA